MAEPGTPPLPELTVSNASSTSNESEEDDVDSGKVGNRYEALTASSGSSDDDADPSSDEETEKQKPSPPAEEKRKAGPKEGQEAPHSKPVDIKPLKGQANRSKALTKSEKKYDHKLKAAESVSASTSPNGPWFSPQPASFQNRRRGKRYRVANSPDEGPLGLGQHSDPSGPAHASFGHLPGGQFRYKQVSPANRKRRGSAEAASLETEPSGPNFPHRPPHHPRETPVIGLEDEISLNESTGGAGPVRRPRSKSFKGSPPVLPKLPHAPPAGATPPHPPNTLQIKPVQRPRPKQKAEPHPPLSEAPSPVGSPPTIRIDETEDPTGQAHKADDRSDITTKLFYVANQMVDVEEDSEHEFKAVQDAKNPIPTIIKYCKKYINAFLNTDGGILYFGVEDDGLVLGVNLSRKERDLLRLRVDATVSQMKPQVDPHLIDVDLVPVLQDTRRSKKLADPESPLFVMLVIIQKGTAPVYVNHDGTAFLRRSGSVYQMSPELIDHRSQHGRPAFSRSVPDLPRDFVGRETEIEQIRQFVMNTSAPVKIVLLNGSPVVGKTTLARALMNLFSSYFPDRHLVIDMKGISQNYVSLSDAMIQVIRTVYPLVAIPSSEAEIRGLYMSCFAGVRSILLMENVGSRDQVKALTPMITHPCLVLITSRKDLALDTEMESLSVKLGALTPPNAIKLLLAMGRQIPPEPAGEIVKLCGFLPLPIRMVGSTLARSPQLTPEEMIKHLSEDKNRLELLTSSAFNTAFDLYNDELRRYLMALSVFPSSFDIYAVVAVIGDELAATYRRIHELADYNEIEYDSLNARYHQNDLLRLFTSGKAAELIPEQLELWRSNFVRFYLKLLHSATLWCENPQTRNKAMEVFTMEGHNFEAAIQYAFKSKNYSTCSRLLSSLDTLPMELKSLSGPKWENLTKEIRAAIADARALNPLLRSSSGFPMIPPSPPLEDHHPTNSTAAAAVPVSAAAGRTSTPAATPTPTSPTTAPAANPPPTDPAATPIRADPVPIRAEQPSQDAPATPLPRFIHLEPPGSSL